MKDLQTAVLKNQGQSLLEVLIALAVIILVATGLIRAVITSIKAADFSRKSSQATSYCQQAMEDIRSYRDQIGWTNFSNNSNGTSLLYGEADTLANPLNLGACTYPTSFTGNINNIFMRCIKLDKDGDNVKATVTVYWQDADNVIHSSQVVSLFTKWQ
jgi:type II secretory pathway pseudopilin PulG